MSVKMVTIVICLSRRTDWTIQLTEVPDEADERTECVEDVSVISTRLGGGKVCIIFAGKV